jgi:hypothetical protein
LILEQEVDEHALILLEEAAVDPNRLASIFWADPNMSSAGLKVPGGCFFVLESSMTSTLAA